VGGPGKAVKTGGGTRSQTKLHLIMSDDRTAELKGNVSFRFFIFSIPQVIMLFLARLAARDAHIRESWVRAMEARIVRDQLQVCYQVEGVNHYETCRELSEKYITLLKENRVRFPDFHPLFVSLTGNTF
jgi:hypothetical protein